MTPVATTQKTAQATVLAFTSVADNRSHARGGSGVRERVQHEAGGQRSPSPPGSRVEGTPVEPLYPAIDQTVSRRTAASLSITAPVAARYRALSPLAAARASLP